MNDRRKILLVHRERAHNLGSGRDDRRFLKRTGRALTAMNYSVVYAEADQRDFSGIPAPDLVLSMSRGSEAGAALESAFPRAIIVNSAVATARTLRHSLYPLLEKSGFAFPKAAEADIEDMGKLGFPFWMKRTDYHHLHRMDVVLVENEKTLERAREHFLSSGIRRVYVQEHCPGERHKFYAIRDRRNGALLYFTFRKGTPEWIGRILREGLSPLMERIGLDVFGGDLIVAEDGSVRLVDINAWPSFRGFQRGAAKVIAKYCKELLE